jgi:hypothetical protein
MKILNRFRPSFNPTARTLDFSALPNFNVKRLYGIINLTANVPIFVAGATGLGISSVDSTGNVITLTFDTSAQGSNDNLNIYYETDNIPIELNYANESGGNLQHILDVQYLILGELKLMNLLLAQGMNIQDDLDRLRNDTIVDSPI